MVDQLDSSLRSISPEAIHWPFAMTPADAAAADNALSLMLWGAAPMLPIILGYTAYVYWVFRAKVDDDAAYH